LTGLPFPLAPEQIRGPFRADELVFAHGDCPDCHVWPGR